VLNARIGRRRDSDDRHDSAEAAVEAAEAAGTDFVACRFMTDGSTRSSQETISRRDLPVLIVSRLPDAPSR
jgi:hypothetical protein